MKRALRWLLMAVVAVCVAIVLGTLVPRPLFAPAAGSGQATRHILVLASPIHTDIAIPIEGQTLATLPSCAMPDCRSTSPTPAGLLFGWGSRAY